MKLINNSKLGKYLYVLLFLIAAVATIAIYFHFTSMKTVSGTLNINKITEVDKTYTRSIYEDYYYRAIGYTKSRKKEANSLTDKVKSFVSLSRENSNNFDYMYSSYYSSLLPQKVSLGYDFKDIQDPKFIISTKNITTGKIREQYGEIERYDNYLDIMDRFAKTYALIVATQDQVYFDDVYSDTKETFKNFYGVDVNISKINHDDFYEEVQIAINNIEIKYFKLKHFKLSTYLEKKTWNPLIASWKWGDSEIYLELLDRVKNVNQKMLDEFEGIIPGDLKVRTIKVNKNNIDRLTIIFKENSAEALFVSTDGYVYTLKIKTNSLSALQTAMNDFLKIAYGIYFTDDPTDSWFIEKQMEAEKMFLKTIELEKEISLLKETLEQPSSTHNYPKRWDKKFTVYKNYYGHFPNKDIVAKLEQEKRKLEEKVKSSTIFQKLKDKLN